MQCKRDCLIPEHSVQVGIRTAYTYENHPFEVLDASWVNEKSARKVIRKNPGKDC